VAHCVKEAFPRLPDCGCVGDQPQRISKSDGFTSRHALRLILWIQPLSQPCPPDARKGTHDQATGRPGSLGWTTRAKGVLNFEYVTNEKSSYLDCW
jgi:hypothetical protein